MTPAATIAGRIGQLAGSSYVRAVAVLSTGQFIAAAIPLVAAPVLGRLYLPADYGLLATYMAVGQVLGVVSTLQLQHGILAEHSDRRAEELVVVCRWTALGVAVVAALVGVTAYALMAHHEVYAQGRGWMLLLPATTWGAGVTASVAALANRRRRYGAMAHIPVTMVAVTVATSIALGLLGWGVHGLFTSYLLGQAVSVCSYMMLERTMRVGGAGQPCKRRLLAVARRHRGFATYTLPSEMIGTVNLQMPVFALSAMGALPLLGAFTRARQLVGAPLMLLGSSIATVFRQRAAEQYRATGSCRPIYAKTFAALTVLGLPPTIVLMIIAPDFFEWFLGANWREAGEVARALAPMLFLRFVCSPLSSIFYFLSRQREEFLLNISSVAVLASSIGFALMTANQPIAIVFAYTGSYAVIYCAYMLRGWSLANGATVEK